MPRCARELSQTLPPGAAGSRTLGFAAAMSAKVCQNTVILGKARADRRHPPMGPFPLSYAVFPTSCVTQRDVLIVGTAGCTCGRGLSNPENCLGEGEEKPSQLTWDGVLGDPAE